MINILWPVSLKQLVHSGDNKINGRTHSRTDDRTSRKHNSSGKNDILHFKKRIFDLYGTNCPKSGTCCCIVAFGRFVLMMPFKSGEYGATSAYWMGLGFWGSMSPKNVLCNRESKIYKLNYISFGILRQYCATIYSDKLIVGKKLQAFRSEIWSQQVWKWSLYLAAVWLVQDPPNHNSWLRHSGVYYTKIED